VSQGGRRLIPRVGWPAEPRNSHPHTSGAENDFVVVHNGIITNYQSLKKMLINKGFEFESETDTEVIPKLAKYLFDKHEVAPSFLQLVTEVMQQLEGAYALLFKSTHFPAQVVGCKRGSPLILGIKQSSPDDDVLPYVSSEPTTLDRYHFPPELEPTPSLAPLSLSHTHGPLPEQLTSAAPPLPCQAIQR
jgi:glucosamine 6-phosphate synthetase-like amidotransferase/phosphosugar isomerase protein